MNKLPVELLVIKVVALTVLGLFVMVLMSCGFMGVIERMHDGGGAQCGQMLVVPSLVANGGQEDASLYVFTLLTFMLVLMAGKIVGMLQLFFAGEVNFGRWMLKRKYEWKIQDYLRLSFRRGLIRGKIYNVITLAGWNLFTKDLIWLAWRERRFFISRHRSK